ncbi:sulfite oxidase-like oxidoreductase [Sulfuracidifex tepidarius]|uniref:Sulfoxide reductase catalytic subunit YedY n=1 Tax=Sulfuracidifex tepidarius TaxID=1294262 RepID=A0A510DRT8_9CREN|nr:sulfite oxidase-like oxidoreductase [Sulfuracidifex tepidarius]BBG22882.1 Sulfoxide reductase catalytic subunit YedY [Sulfuracidifex tepidarius]BBG25643.1 Sulfoxide reductase catalytic subunit YedY [Sulfuracidifex tepidarius]
MEKQTKEMPPNQHVVKNFIIYAEFGIPEVEIQKYNLKVTGLVQNELSFTYDQLMKELPHAKVKTDFHCVTGWSVLDVEWEGVPFSYLLEKAGVKDNVKWVNFYSLDGYTTIIPFEDLKNDPQSMVALLMNGKPIPDKNGFPARPIIPHLYGWKSAKWLTEIQFMDKYIDGYWEERGYHERGNVWDEERFKGMSGKHSRKRPIL